MKLWITVADASRARILSIEDDPALATIAHVRTLENPAGHAKVSELTTDHPGRFYKGAGGVQSAMDPRTGPKEVESGKFAKEVAEALREGMNRREYDGLVVAAPPHFLGLLRAEMNREVTLAVRATVAHDYTNLSDAELTSRLTAVVEPLFVGTPV